MSGPIRTGTRINIFTGSIMRLLIFCLFLYGGLLSAQVYNFEGVPGTLPENWYDVQERVKKNDICMISNMDSFSGKCSLLVDRSGHVNNAVRHIAAQLNCEASKRILITFIFKVDNASLNACSFTTAIWTKKGEFLKCGFRRGGFAVETADNKKLLARIPEYSFGTDKWYRFSLGLPGASEKAAFLKLESWHRSSFVVVKETLFEMEPPCSAYQTFRFFFQRKECFRLWLDDFRAESPSD